MKQRPTSSPSQRTPSASEVLARLDLFGGARLLNGVRLLAVGCGRGELLVRAVAAGADLWGVDDSIGDLDAAGALVPDADLRLGRADDLPFDTGMFDVVCSFGTLAGSALVAAMAEMTRVCRPGGAVVVWPAGQSAHSHGGDPTY
jgi:ubiquinone/menaquinone biosynthesis C-methylase UbiE